MKGEPITHPPVVDAAKTRKKNRRVLCDSDDSDDDDDNNKMVDDDCSDAGVGIKKKITIATLEDDELVTAGKVDDIRRDLDLMPKKETKQPASIVPPPPPPRLPVQIQFAPVLNTSRTATTASSMTASAAPVFSLATPTTTNDSERKDTYKNIKQYACVSFEPLKNKCIASKRLASKQAAKSNSFKGVYKVLSLTGVGKGEISFILFTSLRNSLN